MNLQNILVNALNPYVEILNEWKPHHLESLFVGFGDISIFKADAEDYLPDEDYCGNHKENALAILEALEELGINSPCHADDLYWIIESCAGNIRADLKRVIEESGYKCFLYFNPDSENKDSHQLQEVNIIQADLEPLL